MTDFTEHPVLGNPPQQPLPKFNEKSVLIYAPEQDTYTAILLSTDGRIFRLDINDGNLWELFSKIYSPDQ